MITFLCNIVKGIILGAGAILPGISSGVLCVILGIYEKLITSVLGLIKDFKTNFKFLLPFFIGGLIGILIFGKFLNFVFIKYPMQSSFAFMGLILGTTPSLIKKTTQNSFKLHYILYTLVALLFSILLAKYEKNLALSGIAINYSAYYYILCGFLMSIGIIVPGISSTVILMLLGVYQIYLNAISFLDLTILFPLGIGIILGSIIWLKIIQYLLVKYNVQTFFCIIGFVFGSLLIMYPGFNLNYSGLISIALLFLCILISSYFEKKTWKKAKNSV